MQVCSTSRLSSSVAGLCAVVAATWLATSPVRPDNQSLRRVGADPIRLPMGSSSNYLGIAEGDMLFVNVGASFDLDSTSRETTEQEHNIAVLRSWEGYESNWDHEGARAPNVPSLRAASSFVCALDRAFPMPEPMLHDTGRAGLFWQSDQLYADLEFLENGSIAYYIERGVDRHKGVVAFDKRNLPEIFSSIIPA